MKSRATSGRPREPVCRAPGAFVPQVLDHLERVGEGHDVGLGVVERDIAGALLAADVADRARHAARARDGGGPAEQVPQLHGEEDRGRSRILGIEAERPWRRQLHLAIEAETPFVAVAVARVQVGVRKGMAVGGMLVGVDEARRQHGLAAAVEHRGVGMGGPHGVECRHRADAAVEADVHGVARPAPFRQQDFGADDQSGNGPRGFRRRRERAEPIVSRSRGVGRGRVRHRARGQQCRQQQPDRRATLPRPRHGMSGGIGHRRYPRQRPAHRVVPVRDISRAGLSPRDTRALSGQCFASLASGNPGVRNRSGA